MDSQKLSENGAKITRKLPDAPLQTSSQAAKSKPRFSGKVGRQRTNDEVDDILDYIVVYEESPKGLSRKMRLYYMRHERLVERKKKHAREKKQKKNNISPDASNVVPYRRRSSS